MSGTGSIISQTIAHLPEKEHGSIYTIDYSSIRGKVAHDTCLNSIYISVDKLFHNNHRLYCYMHKYKL